MKYLIAILLLTFGANAFAETCHTSCYMIGTGQECTTHCY